MPSMIVHKNTTHQELLLQSVFVLIKSSVTFRTFVIDKIIELIIEGLIKLMNVLAVVFVTSGGSAILFMAFK